METGYKLKTPSNKPCIIETVQTVMYHIMYKKTIIDEKKKKYQVPEIGVNKILILLFTIMMTLFKNNIL